MDARRDGTAGIVHGDAPEVAQAIEALSNWGEVCPVIIGDRRSFSRALASGQSVIEFEAGSVAAKEAADACIWILSKIKG